MGRKKYIVDLTDDERTTLDRLVKTGKVSARKRTRAQILLAAADGFPDTQIAAMLRCGVRTVERIRERFVTEGFERSLTDLPRATALPKLDGKQEAFLVALACSDVPGGRATWTMQMLADKLVELHVVDTISDETVRRTLKKTI
jgi:transposase